MDRLPVLDLLRGSTIAAMLVANTTSPQTRDRAPRRACADAIFPNLLFVSGLEMGVSDRACLTYRAIATQTLKAFGLGVACDVARSVARGQGQLRVHGVLQDSAIAQAVIVGWPRSLPTQTVPLVLGTCWHLAYMAPQRAQLPLSQEGLEEDLGAAADELRGPSRKYTSFLHRHQAAVDSLTTCAINVWAGRCFMRALLNPWFSMGPSSFVLASAAVGTALAGPVARVCQRYWPLQPWTVTYVCRTVGWSILYTLGVMLAARITPTPILLKLVALGARSLEVYISADVLHGLLTRPLRAKSASVWDRVVGLVRDYVIGSRYQNADVLARLSVSLVWAYGWSCVAGWMVRNGFKLSF